MFPWGRYRAHQKEPPCERLIISQNSALQWVNVFLYLPKLGADLVTALASLDVDDLTAAGWQRLKKKKMLAYLYR